MLGGGSNVLDAAAFAEIANQRYSYPLRGTAVCSVSIMANTTYI